MNTLQLDNRRHPKYLVVGKKLIEVVNHDKEAYERYLKTDTYIHRLEQYVATGPEVLGTTYYMSLARQGADLILKQKDEPRARGYRKTSQLI
jgi:hypothetical protein